MPRCTLATKNKLSAHENIVLKPKYEVSTFLSNNRYAYRFHLTTHGYPLLLKFTSKNNGRGNAQNSEDIITQMQ